MQLFADELTNQNREYYKVNDNKQLLDSFPVIFKTINVEVRVISRVKGKVNLTSTLIILHITKKQIH